MSKTSVAAPSTQIAAPLTTLALALVVALELGGVYALPRGTDMAATDDSATISAPAQSRVASVEASIVAQADLPAH